MAVKNLSAVIKQRCLEIEHNPNNQVMYLKIKIRASFKSSPKEKLEMVILICIFYVVKRVRPFMKVKCNVYNSLIQMPTNVQSKLFGEPLVGTPVEASAKR